MRKENWNDKKLEESDIKAFNKQKQSCLICQWWHNHLMLKGLLVSLSSIWDSLLHVIIQTLALKLKANQLQIHSSGPCLHRVYAWIRIYDQKSGSIMITNVIKSGSTKQDEIMIFLWCSCILHTKPRPHSQYPKTLQNATKPNNRNHYPF